MADTKGGLLLFIVVTALLTVSLSLYSTKRPVEPIREPRGNTNDIYKCCENKCFLLKSLMDQSPEKEVTHKELYDSYSEDTIIFHSRWCPWK